MTERMTGALLLAWAALALLLVTGVIPVRAGEVWEDDPTAPLVSPRIEPDRGDPRYIAELAIQAAERYGVEPGRLLCIVWKESRWDPRARGQLRERGLAQLLDAGEMNTFAAYGYSDPDDPAQALPFLARRISEGAGPRAWYTAWRACS